MRNNLILSGENNTGFGSMMTNGLKDNYFTFFNEKNE